jgi:hypothetical protein
MDEIKVKSLDQPHDSLRAFQLAQVCLTALYLRFKVTGTFLGLVELVSGPAGQPALPEEAEAEGGDDHLYENNFYCLHDVDVSGSVSVVDVSGRRATRS